MLIVCSFNVVVTELIEGAFSRLSRISFLVVVIVGKFIFCGKISCVLLVQNYVPFRAIELIKINLVSEFNQSMEFRVVD